MTVLERVFSARLYVLGLLGAFTLFTGFHATRLTFEAAPDAQLPRGHPIAAVARALDGKLFGDQRLAVALRAEHGSFLTVEGAAKLAAAEKALKAAVRGRAGRTPSQGVTTELTADGHAALVSAALPARSVPDAVALKAALTRAMESHTSSAVYHAEVLTAAGTQGAFKDTRLALLILCAVSALAMAAGLLLYSGSFAVTGLAFISSAIGVTWTFGLWRLIAGNLEPSLLLLPFLVFTIGVAQAFALAHPLLRALSRGVRNMDAVRFALRVVAEPALATLGASALALAALTVVPIPLVEQAGMFGALGILLLAPANLLGLPLLLACITIDHPPVIRHRSRHAPISPVSTARAIARRRLNEVAVVMLAGFALVAITQARLRPLGPVTPATTQLAARAPWTAAPSLTGAQGSRFDRLVVVAQTPPQGCTNFRVMDYLDRLSWRLRNLAGVTGVESLAFALKGAAAHAHGDDARWEHVPRDTPALIEVVGALASEGRVFDANCAIQPIIVHVAAGHAAMIDNVRDTVVRFAAENPSSDVRLSLAGPLAEIAAASDAVRAREATVLLCVTAAFVAVGFAVLRDWSIALGGTLVMLLPLLGLYWCMGARGFGLEAQTLPFVVLALVLAADCVFYVIGAARRAMRRGQSAAAAWRWALADQGLVVGAKAASFAAAFGLWLYSPVRLQAESGILIVVATVIALVLALGALPALLLLMEETVAQHAAEGSSPTSMEVPPLQTGLRAATDL